MAVALYSRIRVLSLAKCSNIPTAWDESTKSHITNLSAIQDIYGHVKCILHGNILIPFVKDDNFENVLPLRIKHVPEAIIDAFLKQECPVVSAIPVIQDEPKELFLQAVRIKGQRTLVQIPTHEDGVSGDRIVLLSDIESVFLEVEGFTVADAAIEFMRGEDQAELVPKRLKHHPNEILDLKLPMQAVSGFNSSKIRNVYVHRDEKTEKRYYLWKDVEDVFEGADFILDSKGNLERFMTDEDSKLCSPLRIERKDNDVVTVVMKRDRLPHPPTRNLQRHFNIRRSEIQEQRGRLLSAETK